MAYDAYLRQYLMEKWGEKEAPLGEQAGRFVVENLRDKKAESKLIRGICRLLARIEKEDDPPPEALGLLLTRLPKAIRAAKASPGHAWEDRNWGGYNMTEEEEIAYPMSEAIKKLASHDYDLDGWRKLVSGRARADLERSTKLNARHGINLARLGMVYWQLGYYARAERYHRYALARNSRLATAHHGMALALDRRKQPRKAEHHHLMAIALNRANPAYHQAYAVFLQRRSRAADVRKRPAFARKHLAVGRKHLAIAGRLNRLVKRFNRNVNRARAYVKKLAAQKAFKTGLVRDAAILLSRTRGPRAPKAYLRAHAEIAAGRKGLFWARQALSGMNPRRLLSGAARLTAIRFKGSAGPKLPVHLVRYSSSINPANFR